MAEAILSGEFAPGSRLDEQHLAQRYSVSRTPVREALRQLATTGLIEMRPRRSAVVASVTPGQLEERSEEHTSELQSLMRISYAVFCLKKKKKRVTPKQNESIYK